MEIDTADLEVTKQFKGKKKKKFYTKIKEQMEFYFSDSNLARDSYLQDLLSKNPEGYVDLEVFKTFNKIKELTDDVNAIVAALSKSIILQVNEEKTKVRRVTPMGKPKDFDACTLYVEKLPPHADHKWIKVVFERFGRVDYINIPRYKVSNKIKGFAFIEFSDTESVKKACEFYKRSGKEIIESDDQCTESKSEKMQKTETYSEKERKARKRKMSSDADEPSHKKDDDTSEKRSCSKGHGKIEQTSDNDVEKKQAPSDRKRKLDNSDDNGKPHKKLKESDSEHPTEISEAEGTETEKHQPSVIENESGLETADSGNEAAKIKKKRKHKKKGHHHSEKPVLRVMSKHEWKMYRNKYLNLQRSTMSYLKKQIMMETQELKEQEPVDEKLENETSNKGLHFQAGVIIKIILKDSITDPSAIKEKVKAATHVAYIDAQLGHSEMFIRCHTPEEAHFIIQEKKLDNFGTVSLLEGTEEKSYWTKIQEDRKAKFSAPLLRKKRGRDKIIAKAAKLAEHKNKHIYFDE